MAAGATVVAGAVDDLGAIWRTPGATAAGAADLPESTADGARAPLAAPVLGAGGVACGPGRFSNAADDGAFDAWRFRGAPADGAVPGCLSDATRGVAAAAFRRFACGVATSPGAAPSFGDIFASGFGDASALFAALPGRLVGFAGADAGGSAGSDFSDIVRLGDRAGAA